MKFLNIGEWEVEVVAFAISRISIMMHSFDMILPILYDIGKICGRFSFDNKGAFVLSTQTSKEDEKQMLSLLCLFL